MNGRMILKWSYSNSMNVERIQMAQEQGPKTCCCEHHELSNLQVAIQYCSNTDIINKDTYLLLIACLIHVIPMVTKHNTESAGLKPFKPNKLAYPAMLLTSLRRCPV
jgi:hypothetical protein